MIMLNPIGEMVLIKELDEEKVSEGGIIIPQNVNLITRTGRGEVIAIGSGEVNNYTGERISLDELSIGDEVIFTGYGGQEIEEDGETYKLIRFTDILAKVEG